MEQHSEDYKCGFSAGVRQTRNTFEQHGTTIAAIDCESGQQGLQAVAEWREALERGHDARDIAEAALILLETHAKGRLDRGMRNLHPEYCAAA